MSDKSGTMLRRLRELKGLKQSELALQIGTSTQNLSAYENGREPNYETLVKLSKIFKCSVDYLIGNSEFETLEEEMYFNKHYNLPENLYEEFKKPVFNILNSMCYLFSFELDYDEAKWSSNFLIESEHLRILQVFKHVIFMIYELKKTNPNNLISHVQRYNEFRERLNLLFDELFQTSLYKISKDKLSLDTPCVEYSDSHILKSKDTSIEAESLRCIISDELSRDKVFQEQLRKSKYSSND